ncbi:MAG: AIR synthase family protein [Candidatus Hodarchaeota archaeon]
MPSFRAGKIPQKVLEEKVFPFLGAQDPDVIHGPGIGRDAAVIRVGRQVIAATTDPITGAFQNIGAYVLHICANDIATFGISPRWFLATILLPENGDLKLLEEIMTSMHQAAESLNIAIIGGHTEVTTGLSRPIIVGFMLGTANEGEFVTSCNAHPGNILILTKGVAIEGTAILATDRAEELGRVIDWQVIQDGQQLLHQLSVVPEALKAISTGGVTAMHDPTEGGIANGLHELADASGLGFIVNRKALIIPHATQKICKQLDINPLNLIASGAMLIATKANKAKEVLEVLEKAGIVASVIGRLVEDPHTRIIVELDGSEKPLSRPAEDALWDALSKPVKK